MYKEMLGRGTAKKDPPRVKGNKRHAGASRIAETAKKQKKAADQQAEHEVDGSQDVMETITTN